ncbi:NADH-quinone oxidoreductase subunit NuoK [Myxococcota bacterium]|nr:NADH-quinone oxidoreductase subunit NuoK [Myxococcota bacterium]
MIPEHHVIGLSAILFAIGVLGVLVRRNFIGLVLSIALTFNASNLAFVGFNRFWPGDEAKLHWDGQVFVAVVIAVAAAQVVMGLSVLFSMFRNRNGVDIDEAGA